MSGDAREKVFIVVFGVIAIFFVILAPMYVFIREWRKARERGDNMHAAIYKTLITLIVGYIFIVNFYVFLEKRGIKAFEYTRKFFYLAQEQ